MISKTYLIGRVKALVRLHIELLGFFSTGFMGRSIYSFLLLFYFTGVFNDMATSIIGYIILYLFVTGSLLFLAIKVPGTREKMFHIYGKDYIYKRLGNPAGRLKDLLVATAGFVALDELTQVWQGRVNGDIAKEYNTDVRNGWKEQGHTPTREDSEELRREVTYRKEAPRPGIRGAIYDLLNIPNPNVPRFSPANVGVKDTGL